MLPFCSEISMPWNLCCPWERFAPIRNTHLSLSSFCIEDWAFSLWELSLSTIYFIANSTPKTQKHLDLSLFYLSLLLTNTFSSSWVRQPFLTERYYNWSPTFGSHQDTFMAPLPGSIVLLVRSLVRKLESWILSHCYYGFYESCIAASCFI